MRPLVIYHGACRDGFCAAWVCDMALAEHDPEFFAGYYGQAPPDVSGRRVVIVDFSYPIEQMRQLAEQAETLLVLDHHKTAQEALAEFAGDSPANTRIIFDMEKSGAGLAWEEFFPERKTRPFLVDYVEDRDLWRHKLPDSKIVNAYLSTLPFKFDAWSAACDTSAQDEIEVHDHLHTARLRGRAVEAKTTQYVAEVRKNAMRVRWEGYDVPIVNAPQVDISELLHDLCSGEIFAMGWWQRADGLFQYSFRSVGDFDVSALAKKHGGGGHKNASGFETHHLLHVRAL